MKSIFALKKYSLNDIEVTIQIIINLKFTNQNILIYFQIL